MTARQMPAWRIAAIAIALVLCGSAEAQQQQQQQRQRVSLAQAQRICNGRAAAANASAGNNAAILPQIFGMSGNMRAVYDGCMAEYGY
jgi:hypothetical protein